jgi:hypothetical protein
MSLGAPALPPAKNGILPALLAILLALPIEARGAPSPGSGPGELLAAICPDEPPDAPDPEPLPDDLPAAYLEGIAPGVSHSGHVRRELGLPERWVERSGERFRQEARGIAQADVAYGDDGRVTWARIEFVKQLAPESAAVVFWLSGSPRLERGDAFAEGESTGTTAHYDESGVHFHIEAGVVREAWMTLPDADLEAIAIEARRMRTALEARAEEPGADGVASFAGDAPRDGSLFTEGAPPAFVPHRLEALSTRYQAGEHQGDAGFWIYTHLQANGFTGEDLTATLRFLLPSGDYYRAPRGTRYVDENGLAAISRGDSIRFDSARWNAFPFFVPHSLVRGGNELRAIYMVSCAGFHSYTIAAVPPSSNPSLRDWPGLELRSVARDRIRVAYGVDSAAGPAFLVAVPIDTTSVGDLEVFGGVRLRVFPTTPEAQRVREFVPPADRPDAAGWDDGFGNFRAVNFLPRGEDGNLAKELRVLVPFVMVGLPAGRHRLILAFTTTCGDFSSVTEVEVELTKE